MAGEDVAHSAKKLLGAISELKNIEASLSDALPEYLALPPAERREAYVWLHREERRHVLDLLCNADSLLDGVGFPSRKFASLAHSLTVGGHDVVDFLAATRDVRVRLERVISVGRTAGSA